MAAAKASPVHRSRTHGQAQQRIQTSGGVNTSSGQHVGSHFSRSAPQANSGTAMPGYSNMDLYAPEDIDMYGPNRTNRHGQHRLIQETHKVTQGHPVDPLHVPSADDNYETQHLRAQLGGIGVLQELLEDQRQEIQDLQECLELVVQTAVENGVLVDPVLREKLDRVRVGSVTLSDTQWSVELKRPPPSSMMSQADGRDQISRLTEQLKAKDNKIKTLEKKIIELREELQLSSDEKSQEIARLQAQLQITSQDGQTSKDLCQSLTGEAEVLRHKLQTMIQQCQGLASELTDFKKNKIRNGQVESTPAMMNTPVSAENQLKIHRRQLEQLEREKEQLSDQLKEVIRMNKRWQKYSQQQDAAKGELTQIRFDLENRNKVLELQCKDYGELMDKLQKQIQENEECVRHRRVDKTEAAHKDDVIRRLQKEVIDLEQDIRKARRESMKYDTEVVKQQLKQYTEDFQKEHIEKEKLKREHAILNRNHLEAEELVRQLTRQLEIAKRETQQLQRENQQLQADKRMNAGYVNAMPDNLVYRERRELTPHGLGQQNSVISLDNFPTLPRDVEHDGPPNGPLSAPSRTLAHLSMVSPPVSPPTASPSRSSGRDSVDCNQGQRSSFSDDEPLQCPRCLREFPVVKHSDFMRHTEQCLDK
ncbi:filamin A-interacting protein 1-like [Lytechinus pictus]|uniref:filamin A-interacting protein 1-like n=1 Tax=Lytechinus pictus TaxID=7653 RepID=UPI0030BA078F